MFESVTFQKQYVPKSLHRLKQNTNSDSALPQEARGEQLPGKRAGSPCVHIHLPHPALVLRGLPRQPLRGVPAWQEGSHEDALQVPCQVLSSELYLVLVCFS